MNVHVLADNRTRKRGMIAEHGLSLLIEHEDTSILFDTGQSDVYVKNAKQMGLPLDRVDFIVLSHGHYDHCGGLPYFPAVHPFPKVFVNQAAFEKKLAENNNGTFREISIPWPLAFRDKVESSIVKTQGLWLLAPGITVCGNIGSDLPTVSNQGLFVDRGQFIEPDTMMDEQMLVIDRGNELCIFLGCSHPGIIHCLNHAMQCFPGKQICAFVAGMHLDGASGVVIKDTIQKLKELGIQKAVPLHCTGIDAICQMKQSLGSRCLSLCAGDSFTL